MITLSKNKQKHIRKLILNWMTAYEKNDAAAKAQIEEDLIQFDGATVSANALYALNANEEKIKALQEKSNGYISEIISNRMTFMLKDANLSKPVYTYRDLVELDTDTGAKRWLLEYQIENKDDIDGFVAQTLMNTDVNPAGDVQAKDLKLLMHDGIQHLHAFDVKDFNPAELGVYRNGVREGSPYLYRSLTVTKDNANEIFDTIARYITKLFENPSENIDEIRNAQAIQSNVYAFWNEIQNGNEKAKSFSIEDWMENKSFIDFYAQEYVTPRSRKAKQILGSKNAGDNEDKPDENDSKNDNPEENEDSLQWPTFEPGKSLRMVRHRNLQHKREIQQ